MNGPNQSPADESQPTRNETNPTTPVAVSYQDAEEARVAVKLLVNSGYSAEQVSVLCSDEKRQEEFRSRLLPAGSPQLNTASSVVSAAGAALGATVGGGLGVTAGPAGVVAGAAAGGVAGAGVGAMLGAATYSDDEIKQLTERYASALDRGEIVTVVKLGDDATAEQRSEVETLLEQARGGVV